MAFDIRSLIRRHWKDVPAFTFSEQLPAGAHFHSSAGEHVIGWYENSPPYAAEHVVFTTAAIWTVGACDSACIPYAEISGYVMPDTKAGVRVLRIVTEKGDRLVQMSGRHGPGGRFEDPFVLISFLRAIVLWNARSKEE